MLCLFPCMGCRKPPCTGGGSPPLQFAYNNVCKTLCRGAIYRALSAQQCCTLSVPSNAALPNQGAINRAPTCGNNNAYKIAHTHFYFLAKTNHAMFPPAARSSCGWVYQAHALLSKSERREAVPVEPFLFVRCFFALATQAWNHMVLYEHPPCSIGFFSASLFCATGLFDFADRKVLQLYIQRFVQCFCHSRRHCSLR